MTDPARAAAEPATAELTDGKARATHAVRELWLIAILSLVSFALLAKIDAFERFHAWSQAHERWQVDELFSLSVVLLFAVMIYAWRRWRDLARETRMRVLAEAEVVVLREILPVCSHCHDIRTDAGSWKGLLEYMMSRSELRFSHGLCPTCAEKHYPGLANGSVSDRPAAPD